MGVTLTLDQALLLTKSSLKEILTSTLTSIWWPTKTLHQQQLYQFTTMSHMCKVSKLLKEMFHSRETSKISLINFAMLTTVSVGQSKPQQAWNTLRNWLTTSTRTSSATETSKARRTPAWDLTFTTCEDDPYWSHSNFEGIYSMISYLTEDIPISIVTNAHPLLLNHNIV